MNCDVELTNTNHHEDQLFNQTSAFSKTSERFCHEWKLNQNTTWLKEGPPYAQNNREHAHSYFTFKFGV